jgi:hypothetical protein
MTKIYYMAISVRLWSYLAQFFLKYDMFQKLYKIYNTLLRKILFPENRAVMK